MRKINKGKIAKDVASLLLRIKAITLNPKKPYRFVSGILSPVYVDCRILISHPKERKIIRNLYVNTIKMSGKKFDVIAGTATAGIPHAAWVADKLNLPMVYVRSKPKDHGKGNQIEGNLKKKQNAAIIEDLISTGGSSVGSAKAVRDAGGITSSIFSIITYGMKKAKDNFKSNKVKLNSLTDFATVVKVAYQQKYIKKEDQAAILGWIKDPATWGKRMGFE